MSAFEKQVNRQPTHITSAVRNVRWNGVLHINCCTSSLLPPVRERLLKGPKKHINDHRETNVAPGLGALVLGKISKFTFHHQPQLCRSSKDHSSFLKQQEEEEEEVMADSKR